MKLMLGPSSTSSLDKWEHGLGRDVRACACACACAREGVHPKQQFTWSLAQLLPLFVLSMPLPLCSAIPQIHT
jgi:hypothetical protein